ncbi:type II toxin-antitoxin system MqsA family antitoxin [Caballeronia sp. LZ002]|nr:MULTISPECIES: type II TA system antitoxin MqsA family protein [unclassified Caballeronia]MDR5777746.1 type II toxin-antitoxin system MqsA family antitoxin [Caballeronia sp. LZ002]MDR5800072.1 type II toxin-antitoxin system MqsA family antitoxin [Caballeronia sp. LZ001]MDR5853171.1 type II toxin-antitoxin system MqsA family antitoxin [Caballeronia sp. LZ003]
MSACGVAELIRDTRDLPYVYKGERTTISNVTGAHCPACGEVVLDRLNGDRYGELVGRFQREVNATFVDPRYIATVRMKLNLDQRQAAEIFGGVANAFSRYKTGKTKPPFSLVKLLKVLDRHPDLLSEVRAM